MSSSIGEAGGRRWSKRELPDHFLPFELEVSVTRDEQLLRQLPAVLLHDAYFRVHSIQPWTHVRLEAGRRSAYAWLVPMPRSLLARREGVAWSESGWVSLNLARKLGLRDGQSVPVTVSTLYAVEQVQPVRIGNYLTSDRIVASRNTRKALGRRVMISSGSRVAVVRTARYRSKKQKDRKVRMNFHLRRTLNIVPDPSTNAEYVQISTYRRVRRRRTRWGQVLRVLRSPWDLLIAGLELLGRFLLRAPRVTLACEESMTNDDSHGVARVSESAAELLGLTPGDSAYFSWGKNRIKLRVLLVNGERSRDRPQQSVVDWTPDFERPETDPESVVAIPGKARALLGVPRTGVVVVQRSILSIMRRRLIALVLPLVAVGVGVAKLDLQPWVAGVLIGVAVVLTLAGDRVPFRPWRR